MKYVILSTYLLLFTFYFLLYNFKESVPSNFPRPNIRRPPDEERLADDAVLRQQPPIPRIARIEDIIPCHEIVIQLESIVAHCFIIQINRSIANCQLLIRFVLYQVFVQYIIDSIYGYGRPGSRNIQWPKIAEIPPVMV